MDSLLRMQHEKWENLVDAQLMWSVSENARAVTVNLPILLFREKQFMSHFELSSSSRVMESPVTIPKLSRKWQRLFATTLFVLRL
jgi:hypothetical protein